MALEALCPTCGAVFSLRDELQGKKVRCTKCEQIFTVGAAAKAKPAAGKEGSVQSKPAAKKPARDEDDEVSTAKKSRAAAKRGRDDEDDEDDDRPKKSASRRGKDDDDEDDEPKAKAKKKRIYHDGDDEDDDGPRMPAKKKSGGGAGVVLGIIGGVVLLLFLMCGGIGWWFYHTANAAIDDVNNQMQAAANANGNVPNPPPGFPNVGGPGPLLFDKNFTNVDDALKGLKSEQASDRQMAARWLGRQQAADAGKQAEVAKALNPLLAEPDQNSRFAAMQACRVWGATDNVPALAKALDEVKLEGVPNGYKDGLVTLGRLKDPRGAAPVARFLTNFFVREDAAGALKEMGPVAEPAVLKYYFDKDGGVREKARALAQGYGTKDSAIIAQAADDVKQGAHKDTRRDAARWLKTARVDPAQQAVVASTLATAMTDPDNDVADASLDALDTWATADTVPALLRLVQDTSGGRQDNMRRKAMAVLGKLKDVRAAEPIAARLTDGGDRKSAGDALIAMGPAAKPAVEKYVTNPDQNVRREVERILASYGGDTGGLKVTQMIADLDSPDGGRRAAAARALATMKVDATQQPKVVAALTKTAQDVSDAGIEDLALKALVVWGTKADAAGLIKIVEGKGTYKDGVRHNAMDVLAKWKAEDAIKPIALNIGTDGGDRSAAGKALIAMGPDLGPQIEAIVKQGLGGNDKAIILECVKVLGAVGTIRGSVQPLTALEAVAIKQKQRDVATACAQAVANIQARGK